jgi:autophagy-related protein 101
MTIPLFGMPSIYLDLTDYLSPCCYSERQQFNQNLAATLSKSLRVMLTHTSSEQGRGAVPPITNSDVSPFPLKISVRVGGAELG